METGGVESGQMHSEYLSDLIVIVMARDVTTTSPFPLILSQIQGASQVVPLPLKCLTPIIPRQRKRAERFLWYIPLTTRHPWHFEQVFKVRFLITRSPIRRIRDLRGFWSVKHHRLCHYFLQNILEQVRARVG